MGSRLKCWVLLLAAIVLHGRFAEFRPHHHVGKQPCAICTTAAGRRKSLDRSETTFGFSAASGHDPQRIAVFVQEAIVQPSSETARVIAIEVSPEAGVLPRIPRITCRARPPDSPRAPPILA